MSRQRLTPKRRARAFGLVEAVCSLLIVAVLLTAALTAVAASLKARQGASRQVRAKKLAEELLAEALTQRYREPGATGLLGIDVGEILSTGRSGFDDVDDYHGWTESPPRTPAGLPMPGLDGWTRSVEVSWVDPADLTQPRSAETGVKRVTVRVSCNDRPLYVLGSILADVPHYPEEQ
jgi:type II secretory pathway pseudopilin PulG